MILNARNPILMQILMQIILAAAARRVSDGNKHRTGGCGRIGLGTAKPFLTGSVQSAFLRPESIHGAGFNP